MTTTRHFTNLDGFTEIAVTLRSRLRSLRTGEYGAATVSVVVDPKDAESHLQFFPPLFRPLIGEKISLGLGASELAASENFAVAQANLVESLGADTPSIGFGDGEAKGYDRCDQ